MRVILPTDRHRIEPHLHDKVKEHKDAGNKPAAAPHVVEVLHLRLPLQLRVGWGGEGRQRVRTTSGYGR